jgi:hypothetical protein
LLGLGDAAQALQGPAAGGLMEAAVWGEIFKIFSNRLLRGPGRFMSPSEYLRGLWAKMMGPKDHLGKRYREEAEAGFFKPTSRS